MRIKGKTSEMLKSDLQRCFNSDRSAADSVKPVAAKTRYVKVKR